MNNFRSEIADISLSKKGQERLEWVRERMPILRHLKKSLAKTKPFASLRIGICLHVEAKTGIWLETLIAGGAKISITGSPGTTQDEIAATLVKDYGVEVFFAAFPKILPTTCDLRDVFLQSNPDLIADNGADLHALINTKPEFSHLKN